MIVFCDTSALMKLYAQEQHSAWTRQQVDNSLRCIVNQITWVEMCAALALKQRTQQIEALDTLAALERLRAEWPIYSKLVLDNHLVNLAGQLASALRTFQQFATSMKLCCFDKQLNMAASSLGVALIQP